MKKISAAGAAIGDFFIELHKEARTIDWRSVGYAWIFKWYLSLLGIGLLCFSGVLGFRLLFEQSSGAALSAGFGSIVLTALIQSVILFFFCAFLAIIVPRSNQSFRQTLNQTTTQIHLALQRITRRTGTVATFWLVVGPVLLFVPGFTKTELNQSPLSAVLKYQTGWIAVSLVLILLYESVDLSYRLLSASPARARLVFALCLPALAGVLVVTLPFTRFAEIYHSVAVDWLGPILRSLDASDEAVTAATSTPFTMSCIEAVLLMAVVWGFWLWRNKTARQSVKSFREPAL